MQRLNLEWRTKSFLLKTLLWLLLWPAQFHPQMTCSISLDATPNRTFPKKLLRLSMNWRQTSITTLASPATNRNSKMPLWMHLIIRIHLEGNFLNQAIQTLPTSNRWEANSILVTYWSLWKKCHSETLRSAPPLDQRRDLALKNSKVGAQVMGHRSRTRLLLNKSNKVPTSPRLMLVRHTWRRPANNSLSSCSSRGMACLLIMKSVE